MRITRPMARFPDVGDGLDLTLDSNTFWDVLNSTDGQPVLSGRSASLEALARRGWWILVSRLDSSAYTVATGAVGVSAHTDGITLAVDDTTPVIEIDFDVYGYPHFIPNAFGGNVEFVSATTLQADQRIEFQIVDTGNGNFWYTSHAWDGATYEIRAGKDIGGTKTETVSNYVQRSDAFLGVAIHTRDTSQGDVRANYGSFGLMTGSNGYSIGLNSASGVVSGTMVSKLFKCRIRLDQGAATGECVYRLMRIFFQPTFGLDTF